MLPNMREHNLVCVILVAGLTGLVLSHLPRPAARKHARIQVGRDASDVNSPRFQVQRGYHFYFSRINHSDAIVLAGKVE